ncbi:MAG: NAD(P)H-hydrate epimerase, partial [Gammaproteobacteria bacterium]|nr:NAD(P)H-hydrate epimerase [Gammaproteobacteria bacterium]
MRTLPETLYRASQVRELDRRAIEDHGVPGYELMSRAGAAAWNVLRARWPQAKRVAIYCGAGNNGGDGYVLGRLAKTEGLDVRVYSLGDAGHRSDDAGRAYKDYIAGGGEVQDFNSADTSPVDVIVDAMLGTGLERPLQGVWRDAVESINQSSAPVLAIDVPTGLQADTGQLLGAAVAADVTATFIALKQGLF